MKKLFLSVLLVLLTAQISNAMTFEAAMKSSKPVVVYIYSETCGTCKYFNQTYSSIVSMFSSKYNFVKSECKTGTMAKVCQKWNVSYVPFIALVNPVNNSAKRVPFECMMNNNCLINALKSFP